MIKLIATDMDGTLLNSQHQISPRNLVAIQKAQEKGLVVTVVTGRSLVGAGPFKDQLGLTGPMVLYNGAEIVEATTGKTIYSQGMDPEDARRLVQLGREAGVGNCIWAEESLYCDVQTPWTLSYGAEIHVVPEVMGDTDSFYEKTIHKILWAGEPALIESLRQKVEDFGLAHTNHALSQPTYLEFFHERVSKGAALEKLQSYYGLQQQEIAALGDAENDCPMVAYAGMGVAMANAVPAVKAVAQQVTATNDEDGVALFIEGLLEGR